VEPSARLRASATRNGRDVEVLAVSFIPRDTHRFPRGKRR